MSYKIKKPKTTKEGLLNHLMMISNSLEEGKTESASYAIQDIIDYLSSETYVVDCLDEPKEEEESLIKKDNKQLINKNKKLLDENKRLKQVIQNINGFLGGHSLRKR